MTPTEQIGGLIHRPEVKRRDYDCEIRERLDHRFYIASMGGNEDEIEMAFLNIIANTNRTKQVPKSYTGGEDE